LYYTGYFMDYLVNLRDLNPGVASTGQAFRDQVEAQLPEDMIIMIYILGRIPDADDNFIQLIETAGTRVEEYNW
jgi:hypothetical protein